jgi:hypothetical protein
MRALKAAAPALCAQLAASGYRGPVAGLISVEAQRTRCAVVPRADALELMRSGGFDADEVARIAEPSPASALPVVLTGSLVKGTGRIVSLVRGGIG